MDKKLLGAALVIILLVLGFIFLLRGNAKKPSTTFTQTANTQSTESAKPATITASLDKLKIEDLKSGIGPEVKTGDTIEINYVGYLTNGAKFDSSYDRGKAFETQIGVGRVIKGWDEGVIGMKVGGKRKLTIPSDLAYGSRALPGIPANSTLIFEVELVSIK